MSVHNTACAQKKKQNKQKIVSVWASFRERKSAALGVAQKGKTRSVYISNDNLKTRLKHDLTQYQIVTVVWWDKK